MENELEQLFTIGSRVEVSSDDEGFKGAWYVATVVEQPSKSPSKMVKNRKRNRHCDTHKKFLVEYETLLADDEDSVPLREYVDASFMRPLPPEMSNDDCQYLFGLNDVVDASYRDGWWTGVVTGVVDDSRFSVSFQNPPEEKEFNRSELRVHRDWVDRKWVRRENQETTQQKVSALGNQQIKKRYKSIARKSPVGLIKKSKSQVGRFNASATSKVYTEMGYAEEIVEKECISEEIGVSVKEIRGSRDENPHEVPLPGKTSLEFTRDQKRRLMDPEMQINKEINEPKAGKSNQIKKRETLRNVLVQRPIGSVEAAESTDFTIKFHYAGKFSSGPNPKYLGSVEYFHNLDWDTLSEMELHKLAKLCGAVDEESIGSTPYDGIYYKIPGKDLKEGLVKIVNDYVYLDMISCLPLNRVAEMFVGNPLPVEKPNNVDEVLCNFDDNSSYGGDTKYEKEDDIVEGGPTETHIRPDMRDNCNELDMGEYVDTDDVDSDELISLPSADGEDGLWKPKFPNYKSFSGPSDPKFELGMKFGTAQEVREAVMLHSIKCGKKIRFVKSESDRVRAECKLGCQWFLFASVITGKKEFQLKGYNPVHTCGCRSRRNKLVKGLTSCTNRGKQGHNRRRNLIEEPVSDADTELNLQPQPMPTTELTNVAEPMATPPPVDATRPPPAKQLTSAPMVHIRPTSAHVQATAPPAATQLPRGPVAVNIGGGVAISPRPFTCHGKKCTTPSSLQRGRGDAGAAVREVGRGIDSQDALGGKTSEVAEMDAEPKDVEMLEGMHSQTIMDGSRVLPGSTLDQSAEPSDRQNENATVSSAIAANNDSVDKNQSLPFVKCSPLWKTIESMEVFQKMPQKPHFFPLGNCKEQSREGLAISCMVTFANVVESTSKLKFSDSRNVIDSSLQTLTDLETHGFDVETARVRLNELLSKKDREGQLQDELKEIESEIVKCNIKKTKLEKQMTELAQKLALVTSERETKEQEIATLQPKMDVICEDIRSAQLDFERLASSPW